MRRALPNPRKKLFPVRALQLPAVALAAPPRSLALVSLHFLYIQNNGTFPNPWAAAASGSGGAPAQSFALRWGLRSHEVCSNGLAQMLSCSSRGASLSTRLTHSRSRGFMHHAGALKLGPGGPLARGRGLECSSRARQAPGSLHRE